MLPEVFEELQVAYVFLAAFCFSLSLSIGKRSTLGKLWAVSAFLAIYLYLRSKNNGDSAKYV